MYPSTLLLLLLLPLCTCLQTGTFATFGNAQTKALIKSWQPRPVEVPEGDGMLPHSRENMKRYAPRPLPLGSVALLPRVFGGPTHRRHLHVARRFVRARILLEDPGIGSIAALTPDDSFCVFLCRFTRAEHSLLLPLWQPALVDKARSKAFHNLVEWHKERFDEAGSRITGAKLEWNEDRKAWAEGFDI